MSNFELNPDLIVQAGEVLRRQCHGLAKSAGWWTDLHSGADLTCSWHALAPSIQPPRNVGELLCLVHSEVSEAMEGARKRLRDDHLPDRSMLEVELADTVIRIFDMAGGLNLDVPGAIADKLAYNQRRVDHRPEARRSDGGKAF